MESEQHGILAKVISSWSSRGFFPVLFSFPPPPLSDLPPNLEERYGPCTCTVSSYRTVAYRTSTLEWLKGFPVEAGWKAHQRTRTGVVHQPAEKNEDPRTQTTHACLSRCVFLLSVRLCVCGPTALELAKNQQPPRNALRAKGGLFIAVSPNLLQRHENHKEDTQKRNQSPTSKLLRYQYREAVDVKDHFVPTSTEYTRCSHFRV
jgi:hypothetical protein